MVELSAPFSPAWEYAYHQSRMLTAGDLAGDGPSPSSVSVDGDDILMCSDDGCRADTRYGSFDFRDGQLENFTVEGRDLRKMIATWSGDEMRGTCWTMTSNDCDAADAIVATVRSAYRTANGDVYITYDLVIGTEVRGAIRHDQIDVNGIATPGSELQVGGVVLQAFDWRYFMPDPGGYSVGMFGFKAPPEGASFQFRLLLRWDGQLIDFPFDFGRLD